MAGKDNSIATAVIMAPDTFHLVKKVKERCVVQVTNVSFEAIMFRMMSTSPESYFVKPCKGIIKPNASAAIIIMLNNDNPKAEAMGRDDFRLEYAVVEQGDDIAPKCANVADLIKAKKRQNRALVSSKFLRCTVSNPATEVKPKEDEDTTQTFKSIDSEDQGKEGETNSMDSLKEQKEVEQNTFPEAKQWGGAKESSKKGRNMLLLGLATFTALLGLWMLLSS